jgi:hypothetical protein
MMMPRKTADNKKRKVRFSNQISIMDDKDNNDSRRSQRRKMDKKD